MHWIIFLKIKKTSLIHSRKLIPGQKITGALNEYKNILGLLLFWYWNSFLSQCYLAFAEYFPAYKVCSIEFFLEGGGGVLSTTSHDRGNGECWNSSDLPQSVTRVSFIWHRMRDLTAAACCLSGMAGCLWYLSCMTALLGSEDAACSGHMNAWSLKGLSRSQWTDTDQLPGQSSRHTQCSINPPWFFPACLQPLVLARLRHAIWLPIGGILISWDLDTVLFFLFHHFWEGTAEFAFAYHGRIRIQPMRVTWEPCNEMLTRAPAGAEPGRRWKFSSSHTPCSMLLSALTPTFLGTLLHRWTIFLSRWNSTAFWLHCPYTFD